MNDTSNLPNLPALIAPVVTFLCSRQDHGSGVECVERLVYEEPPAVIAILEWWSFCRKGTTLRGYCRDGLAVLVWYTERPT